MMDTAKTYYCQNCGAVMEFDANAQVVAMKLK